jgi:hypothetical protein
VLVVLEIWPIQMVGHFVMKYWSQQEPTGGAEDLSEI